MPKQAFGSPGGKTRLAPKIIPLLHPHRIYVEPFAGGAAVYFKKGASEKEVLNDKDAEIAFAFRFLANMTPERFEKLKRLNWVRSGRRFKKLKAASPRNELERFYRFYYLKKASFGLGGQSFNHTKAGTIIGIDHLWRVHERLSRTKVHNITALKIIDKYDSRDTLFYLDPPYPGRGFIGASFGEYTVDNLRELVQKLKGIRGRFILSLSTEHQKYLPPYWRVRRLKVRRSLPMLVRDGELPFQFEIVAANYNFDQLAKVHRRAKLIVPVVLAKGSYRTRFEPRRRAKIKRTAVMIKNALSRSRGQGRGRRRQKGVYTHPGQVPGVILRRL